MRAQLRIGLDQLFSMHSRRAVFARVTAIGAAAPIIWLAVCVFAVLEPLR